MAVNKKKPPTSKNRFTSLNFTIKHDSKTLSGKQRDEDLIYPLEREFTELKLLEKPFESGELNTSVHWLIQKLKEHHKQREELNNTLTELQLSYNELLLKYAEARNMIDELKVSRTLSYSENEKLCASQTFVADLRTQNEGFSITKTGDFVPTDEVCVSCPNLHTLENSFDKNSGTDCCPQYFNFHLSNDGLYSHDENNILRLNKPENSHLVRKDKWDVVFGNKVGSKYSNNETFVKRYNHCIRETNVERVTSNAMGNVNVDQLSPIQDLNNWVQSVETSDNSPELQSVKNESLERTRSNVKETSEENHDSKHTYSGETHGKTRIKQKVCDCTCVNDHHERLLHAKIKLKDILHLALQISTELEKQSGELLETISNVMGIPPERT